VDGAGSVDRGPLLPITMGEFRLRFFQPCTNPDSGSGFLLGTVSAVEY